MNFYIITLFPKIAGSYFQESILKRAIEDKKIKVIFINPRDFVSKKKGKLTRSESRIDKKPYGGGPGMVIQAEPVIRAIEYAKSKINPPAIRKKTKIIWTTNRGKQFTNVEAKKLSSEKDIIIICGRYEGIDSRVKKIFKTVDYSIGPYVLTGGELPANIMVDAISRQIPGILGDFDSVEENRIASGEVYTRPEVFKYKGKNYKVPKVLLSGNHKKIDEWRGKN
jgi:tRNA (guanine37-N1)-methyltransferase